LGLLSVKIPVADLTSSRAWYAEVFELTVELEWPDSDGVVRGVGFAPIGGVMIALREHPEAAAATKNFGFLNISVPREDDLAACAEHLDRLDGGSTADCLDPADMFDTYAAYADRLDAWHAGGRTGARPPGRLRRLPLPHLDARQRRWAALPLDLIHDPDGRPSELRGTDRY